MKYNSLLLLLTLIYCSPLAAQKKRDLKKQQKEEAYQLAKSLVESNHFQYIAIRAYPQRGRQIDLSSRQNYLVLIRETAKASLPYFGVAYSGGYNLSTGIDFDGEIEDYKIETIDKKRTIKVSFRIRNNGEVYDCKLNLSSVKYCTLSVISSRRQSIRYTGSIIQPDDK